MRYAHGTKVSTEKSEIEIRRLLQKYGAQKFGSGWNIGSAFVEFELHDRHVRFVIQLPKQDERRFLFSSRSRRTPEAARREWEQACRQSWRALLLVLKAKLEAVESKIATFEREFLAHIVLPGGHTIGDALIPALPAVLSGSRLLAASTETETSTETEILEGEAVESP